MTNLTKRAMADALKKLLQKHNLEHITIQDVADEAQVSRKTFYYHFHDIYDLVEWMLVEDCKNLALQHQGSGIWVRDVAVNEEDRQFVLEVFTYGVTGLFLSWVGGGMHSDAAFLQDKIVRFFDDSIKIMADRCVDEAGAR